MCELSYCLSYHAEDEVGLFLLNGNTELVLYGGDTCLEAGMNGGVGIDKSLPEWYK